MKHKYNLSSFTNNNMLTKCFGKIIGNLVMIGFWALVLMPQVLKAQVAPLAIDSVVADAPVTFCNGNDGSIEVFASGGTGSYDYKIDGNAWCSCVINHFGGLTPGTHTVYVADGTDTVSSTIVLATPAPIIVSFDAIHPTGCSNSDGQLTAHFSGGDNAPLLAYATVWQNDAGTILNPYPTYSGYDSVMTNLSTGIYSVTVTDNGGCSDTFSFSLVNLCLIHDQEISCNGANDASIVASTSASGSWMYNIDGGLFDNSTGEFYNLTPGVHTIGLTDGTYIGYDSITINEPAALAIAFTWDSIPDYNGNLGGLSALITGGTPDSLNRYHTAWTADSTGSLLNPVPNNLDNYVGGLATGVFTLSIEDEHGCVFSASDTLPDYNLVLDMPISCYGSNDGRVESYTNAVGNYSFSIDDPLNFTNTLGAFENLAPGTHTMGITNGVNSGFKTIIVPGPDSLTITFAWDSLPHCNNNGGGLSAMLTGGTITSWPDFLATWCPSTQLTNHTKLNWIKKYAQRD